MKGEGGAEKKHWHELSQTFLLNLTALTWFHTLKFKTIGLIYKENKNKLKKALQFQKAGNFFFQAVPT